MPSKKNLLVIGGSGFIGQHLVKEAALRNYETTVISLNVVDENQQTCGVDYLVADVCDYDSLTGAMKGKCFSHVVNLGGYINHARYNKGGREVIEDHYIGVNNLVQCLNWKTLQTFVQIGSSDEYGDAPAPQKEDMRERPISPYSLGKLLACQLLQMLYRTEGFPAVILRLFLVYGPGQKDSRFLPQVISGCLEGKSFPASVGQQLRDFCYVEDVVNGIFIALKNSQAQGEVVNLASGIPVEIRQAMETVINIVGGGSPRYGEVPYRTGENMALYADISKAKRLLKWQPTVSLMDGLARTVDFYRAN
jgi:nucleoside-diphosphate-sugar epimerase